VRVNAKKELGELEKKKCLDVEETVGTERW